MTDNNIERNTERQELTAAELDLVAGGMPIYMKVEGVKGVIAPPKDVISSFSFGATFPT